MGLKRFLKNAAVEARIAHDALGTGETKRSCVETAALDLDEKVGKLERKRFELRIG
jgi:hypothetical protein